MTEREHSDAHRAQEREPDAPRTREPEGPLADLPVGDPPARQDDVRGGTRNNQSSPILF
jgi:hypothetical protein